MRISARYLLNIMIALSASTYSILARAQEIQVTERVAKEAVLRIVRHSGLHPDFIVRENRRIPTAIAFIKYRRRYIEYNPTFIASMIDTTKTNWSAVSIMAHELAHHLLGHTLDPTHVSPGDELACDRYSGFILRKMGATLNESLAAMTVAGSPHGTKSHPPVAARLSAISQGWNEPDALLSDPLRFRPDNGFKYRIRFDGDENTYYVNGVDSVVWFNSYAESIGFGSFDRSEEPGFEFVISWNDHFFFVDSRGHIWQRSAHDIESQVGRLESMSGNK